MDDRFLDAIALVKDRLNEEQLKYVNLIMDIYETVDNGYMDWNDWINFYEDKSEDGLEAYMCSVFGLDYTPVNDDEEEEE